LSFDYLHNITDGLDKEHVLNDLMHAYGKDVWKYAYFLTLRPEAADDIMQDTFLRAYQNLYRFRGQASVKTWLFAIVRNASRDYWKSHWVRKIVLFGDRAPDKALMSAEEETIRNFELRDTWKEVFALPKGLREILLLYAHHGLQMKEIAALLGISEGTVKSRLSRARSKVAKRLKEEERK
jgi:RNA polymerase sigma-70 factor, ECF subfamily